MQMIGTLNTPPGAAPSLARLAYQRLGFGPRPEDLPGLSSFGLAAYVDAQLNVETLGDAACANYVAGLDRTDPQGLSAPPPHATPPPSDPPTTSPAPPSH